MGEEEVGRVVKFFAKPSVAAIEVTSGSIKVGDILMYKGHTTDFTEAVGSMQIDNENVDEASRMVKHTIAMLTSANQLPRQMNKKVLKLLQTSSVPAYNQIFET